MAWSSQTRTEQHSARPRVFLCPRVFLRVSSSRGFRWNLASSTWAAFDARYSHSNCGNPSQSACKSRHCAKWKLYEAVWICDSTCNNHNNFYGKILKTISYTNSYFNCIVFYARDTPFIDKSWYHWKPNCGSKKKTMRNRKIVWTHMWLPTEKELSTKLICLSWIIEVNERLYTGWSGPIIEKRWGQRSTNPSLVLSSLLLASWSRFFAVNSHENPIPTRNYLVSEPVIYPFIELPISVGRRTLTSDDFFLADKCEEINANTPLHNFAVSQKKINDPIVCNCNEVYRCSH